MEFLVGNLILAASINTDAIARNVIVSSDIMNTLFDILY